MAILLKEGMQYIERTDISELSQEMSIELCAVEIPLYDLIVVNIYRPDRNINIFFDRLRQLLLKIKLKEQKLRVIIGGDFNINMSLNTPETQQLTSEMLTCNLNQIVDEPTRESKVSSTCIDLIFTNKIDYELSVEENGLSDHKSLIYIFKTSDRVPLKRISYKNKRFFSNKNMEKFRLGLKKHTMARHNLL